MFLVVVLHSASIFNYRTRLMHFYGLAKRIIWIKLEKCSMWRRGWWLWLLMKKKVTCCNVYLWEIFFFVFLVGFVEKETFWLICSSSAYEEVKEWWCKYLWSGEGNKWMGARVLKESLLAKVFTYQQRERSTWPRLKCGI